MSELDDWMAADRERATEKRRLELIHALSDDDFARLLDYARRYGPHFDPRDMSALDYLKGRASRLVDDFFRDGDTVGYLYDPWGRRLIILPAVMFAVIVLLITLNPGGSLW